MERLMFSAGLWVYGQVPDRYLPTGYKTLDSLEARFSAARDTTGVEGIELPFGPVLTLDNIEQIRQEMRAAGVSATTLSVNVVGDKTWGKGSLTNPDASIRAVAKQRIKDSMLAAREMKVKTVNLWMGQDGFDYIFESDYHSLWARLCEGIDECAAFCPDVELSIEYKRMEPRARSIPNSTAQALLLSLKGGRDNVGVTLDIGHALMGGENASQSAVLLNDYGKLFNIHLNDTYGDWDWDMIGGTDHWWQLVEFAYYLKRIPYERALVLDLFPYRQNAIKAGALTIKAFRRAWDIAARLDDKMVAQAMRDQDFTSVFDSLLDM